MSHDFPHVFPSVRRASGVGGPQQGWDCAQHRDLVLFDDSSQTFGADREFMVMSWESNCQIWWVTLW